MSPGAVLLARLQQADGRLKARPVVVLVPVPPYQDLLVCGISSKLNHEVHGFDDLILTVHSDFLTSGLKVNSLIRLGLLTTIPASVIMGQLGTISAERLFIIRHRLANHIRPPDQP